MSWVMGWTGSITALQPIIIGPPGTELGGTGTASAPLSLLSGTPSATERVDSIVVSVTISESSTTGAVNYPRVHSAGVSGGGGVGYASFVTGTGTFTNTFTGPFSTADVMACTYAVLGVAMNALNMYHDYNPNIPRDSATLSNVTMTVTSSVLPVPPPPPGPPPPPPPEPPKPPKPPGPIVPPPPPPSPPPIAVKFHHNADAHAQYDTNYAITVTVRDTAGNRDLYASGVVAIAVSTALVTTKTTDAVKFTINGGASLSNFVTIADGVGTFTLRFPSGVDALPSAVNIYLHANTSGTTGLSFNAGTGYYLNGTQMQGNAIQIAAPGLKFTVQPPEVDEVGHAFVNSVQVSVVNATGVVNTSWTSDIVLTMKDIAGKDSTSLLGGVKTITPVSGVSTFPGLFITKTGFYTLYATSTLGTTVLSGTSTGINIYGEDSEQALRQNIRDDGTTWVKVTGITSPSYSTFTTANKSTLDGDEAVSAYVTCDGIRWVFPYTMKAILMRFKVSVSSLSSTQIISLYSSQDTTTGQNGTWTLQTSMTPTTTGVFIAQFSFSSPLFARGFWLTLNDEGGPATANWYSTQVMGKYIGTPISFVAGDATAMAGEYYVTDPVPLTVLGGAQQKFRSFQIRNNTSSAMNLIATTEPARSTGDTLMDFDNFSLLDQDLNLLDGIFSLPAYASKLLNLRYIITAADNDGSGDHYERLTFDRSVSTTAGYFSTSGTAHRVHNIVTGTATSSQSLSGGTSVGSFSMPNKKRVWCLENAGLGTQVCVSPMTLLNGIETTGPYTYTISTWSGGQEDHMSGVGVLDNKLLLSADDTTTIVVPPLLANSDEVYPTDLRSSCTTFTIPAQTTGAKYFAAGPTGSIFIQNGTAVNSVIYRMSSTGYVHATINPTTLFAGAGVRCCVWDNEHNELVVMSALSAASRIVARYTMDGVFIASVATTTESTREADGALVVGSYLYVLYGGSRMVRHDIQTMANATALYTLVNTASPGQVVLGY